MTDIKFTNCRVQRHLGIGITAEPIRLTDLSPQINLIYGPNGRGKSCLAEALLAVLWGEGRDPSSDITAGIRQDKRILDLRLIGPLSTPCPDLPSSSIAPLYRMALQDLLQMRDPSIADAIRRQLYGNLDPAAAVAALGFSPSVFDGRLSEWREFNAARSAYSEEVKRQAALSRDAAQLPADQNRLRMLDNALAAIPQLTGRLERLRAAAEVSRVEASVGQFDPRLATCGQDDSAQLAAIRRDLKEAAAQAYEADHLLAAATTDLQAAGLLPESMPDVHTLQQLDLETQQLADIATELRHHERTIEEARIALATALAENQEATDRLSTNPLSCLPPAGIQEQAAALLNRIVRHREQMESVAADCEAQYAKLQSMQKALGDRLSIERHQCWLDAGAPIINADALIPQAVRTAELQARLERVRNDLLKLLPRQSVQDAEAATAKLTAWLTATAAEKGSPWLEIGIALVGGLMSAMLQLPIGALTAAATAGTIWYLNTRRKSRPVLDVPAPFAPHTETVEAVTEALARSTQAVIESRQLAATHSQAEQKLLDLQTELDVQQTALSRCLGDLHRQYGIAPEDTDAIGLSLYARLLADLADAYHALTAARGRHSFLQRSEDEDTARLSTLLRPWLAAPALPPEAAMAVFEQICHARRADEAKGIEAEHALRQAQCDHETATDRHANLYRKFAEKMQWLTARLSSWQKEEMTTESDFRAAVQRLRNRVSDCQKAVQAAQNASRQKQAAEAITGRRQHDLVDFLTKRDLADESDPDSQLTALIDQLANWRNFQEELTAARRRLQEAMAADTGNEGVEALSEAELQHQLADLIDKQKERTTLAESMAELRGRLDLVRRGSALAHAEARLAAAEDALARRRDAELPKRIGSALLKYILADMPRQNAPILAEADRLFRLFTGNRSSLVIDTNGTTASLQARDTATDRIQPLERLSSGTRIQLLLAARLAFLQQNETTARPPILLDEILANSDEERRSAIMNAIIAVAGTGRQVFYFTADASELAAWQEHLETHDRQPAYRITSLAAFDQIAPHSLLLPGTSFLPPAPLPAEGLPDYGARLGVPLLNPWLNASAAHLWYISEDTAELAALVRSVGSRCGQLTDADAPNLLKRRAILDQLLAVWRRGRGKPVTWDLVLEAEAISTRFLEDANLCLQQSGGDASEFLQRIALIRGFRKNKQEQLAAHLAAAGSIAPEQIAPVPADEVGRILIREFPGDGEQITIVLARTTSTLFPESQSLS